jgi:hypothetical protein
LRSAPPTASAGMVKKIHPTAGLGVDLDELIDAAMPAVQPAPVGASRRASPLEGMYSPAELNFLDSVQTQGGPAQDPGGSTPGGVEQQGTAKPTCAVQPAAVPAAAQAAAAPIAQQEEQGSEGADGQEDDPFGGADGLTFKERVRQRKDRDKTRIVRFTPGNNSQVGFGEESQRTFPLPDFDVAVATGWV